MRTAIARRRISAAGTRSDRLNNWFQSTIPSDTSRGGSILTMLRNWGKDSRFISTLCNCERSETITVRALQWRRM